MRAKCKTCRVAQAKAPCLFNCTSVTRVLLELDLAIENSEDHKDPMIEGLKQCPEAFKAGEMFNAAFRGGSEVIHAPAGTVICPIV